MPDGRSTFKLSNFERGGVGEVSGSKDVLRRKDIGLRPVSITNAAELNALKLFFLFVERRDRAMNLASISFDKIEVYVGMHRSKIKAALSMLAALELVYVEKGSEHGQ